MWNRGNHNSCVKTRAGWIIDWLITQSEWLLHCVPRDYRSPRPTLWRKFVIIFVWSPIALHSKFGNLFCYFSLKNKDRIFGTIYSIVFSSFTPKNVTFINSQGFMFVQKSSSSPWYLLWNIYLKLYSNHPNARKWPIVGSPVFAAFLSTLADDWLVGHWWRSQ